MKKNNLKFILICTILLSILFTFTVNATDLTASNLTELNSRIIEQFQLMNTKFTIIYSGDGTKLKNSLDLFNIIDGYPYLHTTITSFEYSYAGMNGVYTIDINTEYALTAQEEKAADIKIDAILADIIKPNMNDHQKTKAVHDWIILNGQYDTSLVNNSQYDYLTNGKASCNGYALLTYKMLQKINIPVDFVFGNAGGQAHVWNIVNLGENWFHLDTTWDDPVPDEKGRVKYNYYMLTEKEISKDHNLSFNKYKIPANVKYYDYLNQLASSSSDGYIYENLIYDLNLDVYSIENRVTSINQLKDKLNANMQYYPTNISIRYDKSITDSNIETAISVLFENSEVSTLNYGIEKDRSGIDKVLNLNIEYKKVPNSILVEIEDKIYNTKEMANYTVYAIYGKTKEDITNKVLLHSYNKNFINVKNGIISFNDVGTQDLNFEYYGLTATSNVTAFNSNGFEYITDKTPSDDIKVKIFDKYISFNKTKQPPVIQNGRTLVPMRAVFEVLNCTVNWDDTTRQAIVQKDKTIIKITENSSTAFINGSPKHLDVPAKIINGNVMVPLRFVSEALDRNVNWDNNSKTVHIY